MTRNNETENEFQEEKNYEVFLKCEKKLIYIQKWMSENIGIFFILGGLYTKTSPLGHIFMIYNTVLLLFHVGCLVTTIYICLETRDLNILFECCHHVVFLFALALIIIDSQRKRASISYLIWYFGSGNFRYKYLDEKTLSDIKKIKTDMVKRKSLLSLFFTWCVFISLMVVVAVRPLYDYLLRKEVPDYKDNIIRSTAVPVWYPLDIKEWYAYILAAININTTVLFVAFTVTAMDTLYIRFSEEFCSEFQVLKITLKRCAERAHGSESKTVNVETSLNECIRHHYIINELFHRFQTYAYWWVLIGLMGCTYMICFSGVLFTEKEIKITLKLMSAALLFTELLHIFISCWYGQHIKDLSEELAYSIYTSQWIEHRKYIKYHVLIFQAATMKPLQLTAGGLMAVNLETYARVMQSAFSYFNLIRALRE